MYLVTQRISKLPMEEHGLIGLVKLKSKSEKENTPYN